MQLNIEIVEGKDVPNMDPIGKSDPYVVLKLNNSSQTWKTKYKKDTEKPVWNEKFQIPITTKVDEILTVELWDKDIKNDDEISTLQIQVNKIPVGKVNDSWYTMHPVKGVKTGGKLRMIVHLCKSGAVPFKDT